MGIKPMWTGAPGANLKLARQILKLTQLQLARRAGVDVALICRLERGRNVRPSYAAIVKIARAVNLAPDELFPIERTGDAA